MLVWMEEAFEKNLQKKLIIVNINRDQDRVKTRSEVAAYCKCLTQALYCLMIQLAWPCVSQTEWLSLVACWLHDNQALQLPLSVASSHQLLSAEQGQPTTIKDTVHYKLHINFIK